MILLGSIPINYYFSQQNHMYYVFHFWANHFPQKIRIFILICNYTFTQYFDTMYVFFLRVEQPSIRGMDDQRGLLDEDSNSEDRRIVERLERMKNLAIIAGLGCLVLTGLVVTSGLFCHYAVEPYFELDRFERGTNCSIVSVEEGHKSDRSSFLSDPSRSQKFARKFEVGLVA